MKFEPEELLTCMRLREGQGAARQIWTTGQAQRLAEPDIVRISLTLCGAAATCAACEQEAIAQTEHLAEQLAAEGFAPEALRVQSLSFDAQYVDYGVAYVPGGPARPIGPEGMHTPGSAPTGRAQLVGYTYARRLTLEFPPDSARLARTVDLLAAAGEAVKYSVDCALTERAEAELAERLLADAMADARRRAEGLCAAAGVHLTGPVWIVDDEGEPMPTPLPQFGAGTVRVTADTAHIPAARPCVRDGSIRRRREVFVVWEIAP